MHYASSVLTALDPLFDQLIDQIGTLTRRVPVCRQALLNT